MWRPLVDRRHRDRTVGRLEVNGAWERLDTVIGPVGELLVLGATIEAGRLRTGIIQGPESEVRSSTLPVTVLRFGPVSSGDLRVVRNRGFSDEGAELHLDGLGIDNHFVQGNVP